MQPPTPGSDLLAANASGFGPMPDKWAPTGTDGQPTLDEVAQALMVPSALLKLSHAQACQAVGYMRPLFASAGTVLASEHEDNPSGDLLLIVSGVVEVRTHTLAAPTSDVVELCTLGPGSLVGEAAFLDGQPRAATFIARTDITAARLSRSAMEVLAHDDPFLATHLMTAICLHLAVRLRQNNRMQTDQMEMARALQGHLEEPVVPLKANTVRGAA